MINLLANFIRPKEEKAAFGQVTPNIENLLNKIIYGNFINQYITWYDGSQDTFVKEGYQSNAMVFSIIRKICDKDKLADLQILKPKTGSKRFKSLKYSGNDLTFAQYKTIKKKEMDFVNTSDPLVELMNKPNKKQNHSQFLNDISSWYRLLGEAFIYGVGPGESSRNKGKYTELYVLPANLVTIQYSGDFRDPILGYKLKIGEWNLTIPKEDVLHIKEFNPQWDLQGSQDRGQSRLLAGAKVLKTNNAGIQSKGKSNENMGAKGIVSPNVNNPELFLDPIQRENLDQNVEKRVNGKENRDKVVTSGLPLQYTQIGFSPQAMELINGLGYDDEKLCGLWGVNPVLFKPDATHTNLREAQKSLVTDIVMPFLNEIELALSGWLNPKFGTNYVFDYDVSSYPELQPDVKMIMDAYGNSRTITKNELRVMLGWDELLLKGMDTVWVGQNEIPIEEAIESGLNPDFSDFNQ
jgi:HK97 family phage portal protein